MGIDESICRKCNCNKNNEFNLDFQNGDKKNFTQMTTKNKQFEENNLFKIKAKSPDEPNLYDFKKLIYIQSRIKGFLFRKSYPSIKQLLINLTNNKIENCKIRFDVKLDSLEKIIKEKFGNFESNNWKKYYDISKAYLFNYNPSKYGKLFPCKILIYKNFNSNEEISYYIGNINKLYMRCGYGKLITKNGIISEGNWVYNKLNGWGRVIDSQNKIIGEGLYIDNLMEGYGKYYFSNGDFYEGYFKNGKMDGKGKYYWKDGEIYEGEYKNGIKEGNGVFYWTNGKRYKGGFLGGKPDGNGKFYYNDNIIDN